MQAKQNDKGFSDALIFNKSMQVVFINTLQQFIILKNFGAAFRGFWCSEYCLSCKCEQLLKALQLNTFFSLFKSHCFQRYQAKIKILTSEPMTSFEFLFMMLINPVMVLQIQYVILSLLNLICDTLNMSNHRINSTGQVIHYKSSYD